MAHSRQGGIQKGMLHEVPVGKNGRNVDLNSKFSELAPPAFMLWFVTWRIGCIVPVHMPAGPPFSNSLAMLPRAPFGNLTWQWERQILDRDIIYKWMCKGGLSITRSDDESVRLALIEPANPSNVPLGGFIWVPPLKHPLKWFSLIQNSWPIHDDWWFTNINHQILGLPFPWAPMGSSCRSPNPAFFATLRRALSSATLNLGTGYDETLSSLSKIRMSGFDKRHWGNCGVGFSWIVQLVEL